MRWVVVTGLAALALLILFFPLAGSIAWWVAGRPEREVGRASTSPEFPEYERPGRAAAADRPGTCHRAPR